MRARVRPLFPPNLTRVFIKESSCSMALRRNGDRLWHNYTNPCMSLGLMEAEHLTQTKCTRADQFRGAFFSPLEPRPALPHDGAFTYAMHLCYGNHSHPGAHAAPGLVSFHRCRNEEACFKEPHIKESQRGGGGGLLISSSFLGGVSHWKVFVTLR